MTWKLKWSCPACYLAIPTDQSGDREDLLDIADNEPAICPECDRPMFGCAFRESDLPATETPQPG